MPEMWATFAICHSKWLWRPQTKKSDRNFTVTGMSMSCLDRARTANLGTENLGRKIIQIHHSFTTQTSTELVERTAALRDLKLLVGNLNNSSLLCGLVYMEMWATFARCHSKWLWRPQTKKSDRNFTVTGMSMSCLDGVRTANLGTENLERKIIQIHHWFTTQTSTLTMFGLDRDSQLDNSTLPMLWSLHELNVFARKNSGNLARMHSLNKQVEQVSFRQCVTFCKHRQLKRLAAPLPTHSG